MYVHRYVPTWFSEINIMAGISGDPRDRPPCVWAEYFSESKNNHVGLVLNGAKFNELKCAYEIATKSHFVGVKTSANFGQTGKPRASALQNALHWAWC